MLCKVCLKLCSARCKDCLKIKNGFRISGLSYWVDGRSPTKLGKQMKEKNNRPEKKTPSISSGDNGSSTSGREGKGVRAEGAERPRENAGIQ